MYFLLSKHLQMPLPDGLYFHMQVYMRVERNKEQSQSEFMTLMVKTVTGVKAKRCIITLTEMSLKAVLRVTKGEAVSCVMM